MIFVGKVKSTRSKVVDKKLGLNLENSRKLANLGKKYSQGKLLSNRLTDYNYLGQAKRNGRPRYQGAVELDFYHPEYKLEAGFIDLKNNLAPRKRVSVTYTANPFTISDDVLKKITESPSNEIKLVSVANSFYSRKNTKYSIVSASVYIDLYVEGMLAPKVNTNLAVLQLVLEKRLQLINENLAVYKSSINVQHYNSMISINIDAVHGNAKKISELVVSKLFTGDGKIKAISKEEKRYALDKHYSSLEYAVPILDYSQTAIKRFINSLTVQPRSKAMDYLKKMDRSGILTTSFKVGRVYLEGHVDDELNDHIVNDMVRKIDPNFDPKKHFDFSRYQFKTEGFKQGKTVVLGVKPMKEEDRTKVYTHLFKTSEKKENKRFLAELMVLKTFLYQQALQYLRHEKGLGYLVDVSIAYNNEDIMMMVSLLTHHVHKARPEFENLSLNHSISYTRLYRKKDLERLLEA